VKDGGVIVSHQSLSVVIGGIVVLLLLIKEVLDLAATIDYVEQKFPRLVKWAERKAWQRILLIILTIMYAGILYEIFEGPVVSIGVPKVDPGAKDAEITQLQRDNKALRDRKFTNNIGISRTVANWKFSPDQAATLREFLKSHPVADKSQLNQIGILTHTNIHQFEVAQQISEVFKSAGYADALPTHYSKWSDESPFYGVMVYGYTSKIVGTSGGDPNNCLISPNAPDEALLLRDSLQTVFSRKDVHLCLNHQDGQPDWYQIIVGEWPSN
jgi:hypothetical protein